MQMENVAAIALVTGAVMYGWRHEDACKDYKTRLRRMRN